MTLRYCRIICLELNELNCSASHSVNVVHLKGTLNAALTLKDSASLSLSVSVSLVSYDVEASRQ